ncbi:hypothetical protein K7X08_020953 [Anisodus acutangulus]|uniref:Uncharacterized protein n=1 Tax=Anisodus acutangulus TaxID=402998 RepID=A0A9Q1RRN1_9SOLA|nr:hypothetical protein K7X08_020953 [Anisodus acutangulus]
MAHFTHTLVATQARATLASPVSNNTQSSIPYPSFRAYVPRARLPQERVSSTKPMDYKEKIEPCPAKAADSIADGLGKNLSFDASDSTSRQPRKGPKEAKTSAIDLAKFQLD